MLTHKNTFFGVMLMLVVTRLLPAHAAENTKLSLEQQYGATEHRLENGFRVVLVPDSKATQTAVTLVYFAGSLADPEGKSGLAHLVEHLLFNASVTKGTSPSKESLVSEMARRNIGYNGNTSFERTLYHAVFSKDQDTLNWLLEQEALRMSGLVITQADITKELPIVLREKEIGDSNPTQQLSLQILPIATHFAPYSRAPIGKKTELEKIAASDAQTFYQTHYRPDNALLVVSGQFDAPSTLKQIQAQFGVLLPSKKRLAAQEPPAFTEVQLNSAQHTFTVEGDAASVSLFYPLPAMNNARQVASVNLLSQILSGSPASRLYKSLVSTGQATSVMAIPLMMSNAGLFQVIAVPSGGDSETLNSVHQNLLTELDSLKKAPVTEEELTWAKALLHNYALQIQTQPATLGYLLAETASSSDWRLWFAGLEAAQAMTLVELQHTTNRLLQQNNPVARLVSQMSTGQTVAKSSAIQQPMPAVLPNPTAAHLQMSETGKSTAKSPVAAKLDAQFERFNIGDNLAVALWSKPTSGNRVQGLWNLRIGTAESLFGKRILADVTGSMLAYGSQNLNQRQLFDRVNTLGASMSIVPSDDRLSIRFDTPAQSLPDLLEILVDVLRDPALPEQGLQTVKGQLQVAYQAQAAKPDILADEALTALTSSYAIGDIRREPSMEESLAALKSITLDEVKAFHQDFYAASGQLILSGEFDVKAARKQLEILLGSWRSRQPYQRPPEPYVALTPGQHFVSSPSSKHGIYIAKLRLPLQADEPDALALKLANFVLGEGALQSRLGKRLRKQEGISYSIGSKMSASAFEPRATFTIAATYSPAQRQVLSKAVHEELAVLVKNGITEKEFKNAKDNWRERNDLSQLNDGQILGKLNLLLRMHQGFQYYAEENASVEALTLAQVNTAIVRYLNPDQLLEVFADAEIDSTLVANDSI